MQIPTKNKFLKSHKKRKIKINATVNALNACVPFLVYSTKIG
jgi:hypothetical protein